MDRKVTYIQLLDQFFHTEAQDPAEVKVTWWTVVIPPGAD